MLARLEEYCAGKPGVSTYYKPEWNWQRYFVGGKHFADFGVELFPDGSKKRLFVTFACDPAYGDWLTRTYRAAAPGYYTEKSRNVTIWTTPAAVPARDRTDARGLPSPPEAMPSEALLREIADRAYALAVSKLTKKARKELGICERDL